MIAGDPVCTELEEKKTQVGFFVVVVCLIDFALSASVQSISHQN